MTPFTKAMPSWGQGDANSSAHTIGLITPLNRPGIWLVSSPDRRPQQRSADTHLLFLQNRSWTVSEKEGSSCSPSAPDTELYFPLNCGVW